MSITSKQYFTTLSILFYAMAAGQAMLAIVAYFITGQGVMGAPDPELGQTFLMIALLLIMGAVFGSRFLYKRQLAAISTESLRQKMNDYRTAFILQLAILEGPALFCLVTYLVTGDMWLLLLGMAVLLYFLLHYPSINRVSNDLELEPHERNQLEDPHAIIADSTKP